MFLSRLKSHLSFGWSSSQLERKSQINFSIFDRNVTLPFISFCNSNYMEKIRLNCEWKLSGNEKKHLNSSFIPFAAIRHQTMTWWCFNVSLHLSNWNTRAITKFDKNQYLRVWQKGMSWDYIFFHNEHLYPGHVSYLQRSTLSSVFVWSFDFYFYFYYFMYYMRHECKPNQYLNR